MGATEEGKIPLLLFDGDCGFCSTCARLLRRLAGGRGSIRVVPWQEFDRFDEVGVRPSEAAEAVWLVTPDGEKYRGAAACNRALGGPLYFFYRIPGIQWLQDRLYDWVARHRHQFPGGTPACRP